MANKIAILSALAGLAVVAPALIPPSGGPALAQLQLGPPPTTQQRPPPPGQTAPPPRPQRPPRQAAPSDAPP
ncbi:MAG: hypothetical protein Q8O26_08460, partial [Phreatobacter sp.]|uniref:hypothetical protein n=1 Tax=Phreatobacter sp. TaxID=1966341 RepID=UPI002779B34A|nr:hypothetical protein [Phreatobacter sp.]